MRTIVRATSAGAQNERLSIAPLISDSSAAALLVEFRAAVAHGRKLRFLGGQALRIGLHLLLLAADLVEAADILAQPFLVVHHFADLFSRLPISRRCGGDLLLQIRDLFELLAGSFAQSPCCARR